MSDDFIKIGSLVEVYYTSDVGLRSLHAGKVWSRRGVFMGLAADDDPCRYIPPQQPPHVFKVMIWGMIMKFATNIYSLERAEVSK